MRLKIKTLYHCMVSIIFLLLIYQGITGMYGMYIYAFILFGVVISIVIKSGKNIISMIKKTPLIPIFAFIGIFITILFMNNNIYDRIIQILFVYGTVIIGYTCYQIGGDESVKNILKLVNGIVFLSSLIGLFEWITDVTILEKYYYTNYFQYTNRIVSCFGHPITFGSMLLFGILITCTLDYNIKTKIVLLILYILCIIATQSRSAWLALVITMGVYFILIKKNSIKKRHITLFVIMAICLLFFLSGKIGYQLLNIIIIRIMETENSTSFLQRVGSIELIMRDFWQNSNILQILLGHGERASKDFMTSFTVRIKEFGTTDNSYVQCLYNYGIIFILSVFYMLYSIIRNLVKNVRENTYIEWIMFPQFIAAFFYELTENHVVSFCFLFLLGAYLCKMKSKDKLIGDRYEQQ